MNNTWLLLLLVAENDLFKPAQEAPLTSNEKVTQDKPSAARTMAPGATFPMQRGMALISRLSNPNAVAPGQGSARSGHVLGVFDIRNPGDPSNSAPSNALLNWTSASNSTYRHPDWINEKMGEVFGIEIDNSVPANPQVFVGSSGTFVGNINGVAQYSGRTLPAVGSTGGDVYKINGTSGNVSLLNGSIPSISYAQGGGRGAEDITIPLNTSNGAIKSINIISGGSGYTNIQPLVFSGGGGTGASGYVTVTSGVVTGIVITAAGTGYGTSPVTVTVNTNPPYSAGTGFSGEVIVGYPLVTGTYPVTTGGSGYTESSATAGIIDGDGSGAFITRVLSSGSVTSYNVTSAGTGFTAPPKATINNRYTGVGNIGYNYAQKVVYTASMDNGNIYAINAETGALVGSPFDHRSTVADNPNLAVTDIRRLAIGMAWNPRDNRLYYSRIDTSGYSEYESIGTRYRYTHNEVVSVGLHADGSINTSDTQRQEIKVPVTAFSGPDLQNSLISDIEFTSDGLVALLGEMSIGTYVFRLVNSDYRFTKGSHNAIAREFRFNTETSSWPSDPQTEYKVGNMYSGYNNAGGADFGYNNSENPESYYDSAVLTGDYLNGDGLVYGIQISPLSQGNFPTTTDGQFRHYVIDDQTEFLGAFAEKTGIGDVDVFSGVDYPAEDIALEVSNISYPSNCGASDGVISLSGTGTGLTPNTPYPVTYIRDGGTPVTATLISDTSGVIHTPNLPAGAYTEIKIQDLPTYTSNALSANLSCVILSGTVFHDVDGLNGTPNNTVNGTPIQSPSGTDLNANLFSEEGAFIATTPIDGSGNYQFDVAPNTNYLVTISVTPAESTSAPATTVDLPTTWVNTGENVGTTQGSDGTVNGILAASVLEVDRPNVNFGIQQPPQTAVNLQPAQPNPGGTTCVTVPAAAFVTSNVVDDGTEELYPNTEDPSPGAVTGIVLTAFPTNATSISIDGETYTDLASIQADYENGIPTNAAGQPTVPICVDPIDGNVAVVLAIAAIDEAGFADATPGSITLPFTTTVILSGTVFHDVDGLNGTPNNTVNGTTIQSPSGTGLNANLFSEEGAFIDTTPIDGSGNYQFDVAPNTNYLVTISVTPAESTSAPATTVDLPTTWVNKGENVGTTQGSDGTVNGILAASVLEVDRPNVNFGIQQIPDSEDVSWTLTTQPNLGESIVLDGVAAPILTGEDPEDHPASESLSGKKIVITSLPTSGELWYEGTRITLGDDGINPVSPTNPFTIPALDPSEIALVPTLQGSTSITFNFAYVDIAGFQDPTPAVYELNWGAPLPVNLISFRAEMENSMVVLNWQTASEVNSSHFVAEQSTDGRTWRQVANVRAKGNTATQSSYRATHSTPSNGINFYRLKMVDIDGSAEFSTIVSVSISNSLSLRVFPNPVRDQLTIDVSDWNNVKNLRIVNASGKTVLTKTSGFRASIGVQTLSSGVYLIVVENKNGSVDYRRIIISK